MVRARQHRVEEGGARSPQQSNSVGLLPLARSFLACPFTHLSMPVFTHRGRFQLHASLGFPRQHYTYEPVCASDP